MVADLNMHVKIVDVPIMREIDGLALSSRNIYLSPEERQAALVLYRSLMLAQELIVNGEREIRRIKEAVIKAIGAGPRANSDYVEILSIPNLTPIDQLKGKALLALAVRFRKTRLIDNTVLEA